MITKMCCDDLFFFFFFFLNFFSFFYVTMIASQFDRQIQKIKRKGQHKHTSLVEHKKCIASHLKYVR